MSWAAQWYAMLNKKCYEPTPRNHDGIRYHGHRFPIKGGITLRDVMIREMCKPNPFFEYLQTPNRKWFTFK